QLARLADRDEALAEMMRERRAEDEPARLDAAHEVEAPRIDAFRHPGDRLLEPGRAREERRDVLEEDPLLREVGHVTDVALDQGRLGGDSTTTREGGRSQREIGAVDWFRMEGFEA